MNTNNRRYRYRNDGYSVTLSLSQFNGNKKYRGYSATCRYKYNKKDNKYIVSMWLQHTSFDGLFRIEYEGIDTQPLSGTRKTIRENICRVVEQMVRNGYFDLFIDRYEYDMECCEKGSEIVEQTVSDISDNPDNNDANGMIA